MKKERTKELREDDGPMKQYIEGNMMIGKYYLFAFETSL